MKKYKKKPVTIEAIKLEKTNIKEVYTILYGEPKIKGEVAQKKWDEFEDWIIKSGMHVETPEGTVQLTVGNYLVKGYSKSLGEHFWPVEAGYFDENYEEVKDAEK